jgi:heme oxygenase (biliverdin-IX-beta and delta-forming)
MAVKSRYVTPSGAGDAASILRRLWIATAEQHRRLDGALDVARVGFDRGSYRTLLEDFYGLHAAWEPWALAQFSSVLPGFYERRQKLHLLRLDLLHLGASEEEIQTLPVCAQIGQTTTFSGTLGAAYVLEGSTLGGQILSRRFSRDLGVSPERGCAYFHGYGANTAAMWREFGQALESFAALIVLDDEILTGAKNTFAAVHEWLVDRHE